MSEIIVLNISIEHITEKLSLFSRVKKDFDKIDHTTQIGLRCNFKKKTLSKCILWILRKNIAFNAHT